VTWMAGGFYFLLWGYQLPKTILGRVSACFMLLGSLVVPLFFAHGLQTMPVWNMTLKWNAVPVPMIEAIDVIKQQSRSGDLLQDSEDDPRCIVSGLTERQNYAMDVSIMGENTNLLLTERLKELEAFKQMTREREIKAFIQTHRITWYLLRPESKVSWPDSFKNSAIFQSGGYRVYYWAH